MIPTAKSVGKTVAIITVNVGLQLVNTGPSAAPNAISPKNPVCLVEVWSSSSDFADKPNLADNRSHSEGNNVIIPNPIKITPEIISQTKLGIPIKAVDAFKTKVKIKIETEREAIIVTGFFILLPATAPLRITGSNVNTQGAKTVSTPAIKEIKSKSISLLAQQLFLKYYHHSIFLFGFHLHQPEPMYVGK